MRIRKLLAAIAVAASAMTVAGVAAPSAPASAYTLSSRVGITAQWYYGTQAEYDNASLAVANAGFGWVRVDANWNLVQAGGSGSWDWSATDKMVAAANSRGLRVLLLPTYSPSWANGGSSDVRTFPTNTTAWANFVTAAAQRYIPLGVTAYEIWNEPNIKSGNTPSAYVSNVLTPAANALRAVSQTEQVPVTVVDGAPASVLNTSGVYDPYAWVSGIYSAGGKPYFDAQAVHPYCWPGNPATTSTYNHLKRVDEIHATMAANGDGAKQIWATEFGFPTGGPNSNTEAQQSSYLQSALSIWTQTSWLSWTGPMFLYVYRDANTADTTDPEKHFGLVHSDFSPKPAMTAMPSTIAALPAAPAAPTSGYGSGSGGGGTGGTTEQLLNGFENLADWSGQAAEAATTSSKTQGAQSITATYTVPGSGWSNYLWSPASPYLDLSTATQLKIDVYPTSATPGSQHEPIALKVEDHTGGVIYEQPIAHLASGQWNTVTVDLTGISAANRDQISSVNLYLYSGWTSSINGRSSIAYRYDNLRAVVPAGSGGGGSGVGLLNGFESLADWSGQAGETLVSSPVTQGTHAITASFTVPSSGWSNYYWAPSPAADLSSASSLKIDIRPSTQTPSGQSEPIALKLQDAAGGVIYEQRVGHLTAGQWTTVTIDLTTIPSGSRAQVENVDVYLWSGWGSAINGRSSVAYTLDNLRTE